jgi:DNA-binding NarL/FixJ family response regulator
LVVEDFEPFQRFIASTLQKRPELQVICKVADGLEAVQKAQELQPDLIVLDIGLPRLNGIEAARRIRKLSPESKILFLSQESSADAVQAALALGAQGYVVKAHAGSELLTAVEAVLRGNQFVGSGPSGNWLNGVEAQAPNGLCQKEGLPSPSTRRVQTARSHEVHFYPDDASFLLGFTCSIESALRAGNVAIVIATESHRKSLLTRMQARSVDIAAAIEQGSFVLLDVAETLSAFMVNDLVDPVRFSKAADDLLGAAAKAVEGEQRRVAVYGEAVSVLWAQGKADAAVQLEHLWDQVARIRDVDVLCGYVLQRAQREQDQDIYQRICAEHSVVYS